MALAMRVAGDAEAESRRFGTARSPLQRAPALIALRHLAGRQQDFSVGSPDNPTSPSWVARARGVGRA